MKNPESAMIETHELHAVTRGLAVTAFGMSFFASLVFWWIPFGFLLCIAASTFGAVAFLLGVRTKERGLYFILGAWALSATAATTALLCTKLSPLIFVEF